MKKGDLKKQEIMHTAELLFCQNGYEQTSIQDILDQLQTSKGSFYHHFISKEALLATMCANRAKQSFELAMSGADRGSSTTEKLNRLLTGIIPLQDEKLSFILMLLPTFVLPEGKSLKTFYCTSLRDVFITAVRDIINEGITSGEIICEDPDIFAEIVISLVNRLWITVCDIIIEYEREGKDTDLSELLHLTEQYRTAIERILSIEYGSIMLIDIPSLKGLKDQIHSHWNQKQPGLNT